MSVAEKKFSLAVPAIFGVTAAYGGQTTATLRSIGALIGVECLLCECRRAAFWD